MVLIVGMKSVLVFRFDWIKAKFNYQHGRANYNYSNYIIGNTYHIIGNLLLAALMNHHFYFFNMIFSSTQPTCVGSSVSYSHTDYMFNNNSTVSIRLNIVYLITPASPPILHRANVAAIPNDLQHLINKIHKTIQPNPLLYAFSDRLLCCCEDWSYWTGLFLANVILIVIFRALADSNNVIKGYFVGGDYVGIIGIIPELLFIVEFLVNKLVDLLYWLIIDKKRLVMIINENSTENIQIHQ
jgi:hypothetical protein